jgi:hypothetical protein
MNTAIRQIDNFCSIIFIGENNFWSQTIYREFAMTFQKTMFLGICLLSVLGCKTTNNSNLEQVRPVNEIWTVTNLFEDEDAVAGNLNKFLATNNYGITATVFVNVIDVKTESCTVTIPTIGQKYVLKYTTSEEGTDVYGNPYKIITASKIKCMEGDQNKKEKIWTVTSLNNSGATAGNLTLFYAKSSDTAAQVTYNVLTAQIKNCSNFPSVGTKFTMDHTVTGTRNDDFGNQYQIVQASKITCKAKGNNGNSAIQTERLGLNGLVVTNTNDGGAANGSETRFTAKHNGKTLNFRISTFNSRIWECPSGFPTVGQKFDMMGTRTWGTDESGANFENYTAATVVCLK